MQDFFKDYHPAVNFAFFISILAFTMFFQHPVLQLISMLGAMSYVLILKGRGGVKKLFIAVFLTWLLISISNPIFNHRGVTILFYSPRDGNPITLEAILYGISAGAMFMTIILWFACHNEIMTSDRIMFLFSKVTPALSLIFAMVLRFVPMYKDNIRQISYSRACIGLDPSKGNIFRRIRSGLTIFSIFVTGALEGAIETSDSMKARGYGLTGRTSYSLFRFSRRDAVALTLLIIADIVIIYLGVNRYFKAVYYPAIKLANWNAINIFGFVIYGWLAFMPTLVCAGEEIRWKYYR